MELSSALEIFSSLAQETRLRVYRYLLEYGDVGVPAGEIALDLKLAPNTLSFHLAHLAQAGLVRSVRQGRQLFYAAKQEQIEAVIGFLQSACCRRAGACAPRARRRTPSNERRMRS